MANAPGFGVSSWPDRRKVNTPRLGAPACATKQGWRKGPGRRRRRLPQGTACRSRFGRLALGATPCMVNCVQRLRFVFWGMVQNRAVQGNSSGRQEEQRAEGAV